MAASATPTGADAVLAPFSTSPSDWKGRSVVSVKQFASAESLV